MPFSNSNWLPKQVLHGHDEPIFARLSPDLIANLRSPTSENALIWNLIYPLARPGLSFARMSSLRPISGTPLPAPEEDSLTPYFWGWSIDGNRMPGLEEASLQVDGGPGQTEADLLLLGKRNLVLIEAKRFSGFGRCSRYLAERCPEIYRSGSGDGATDESIPLALEFAPGDSECRYWAAEGSRFDEALTFGDRPDPSTVSPVCSRHYQLGRLFLLGSALARIHACTFHFWVLVPRAEWRRLEADWNDFASRVRDEEVWRRLRVIAWEDLQSGF